MQDWIEEALSLEQQKPFDRNWRNTCILAGAGSGKTRTLTHLLAADIAAGILPNEIVAFTFTEKAAAELLNRVYTLTHSHFPKLSLEGIYIGTIHAWCLQYLREQPDYYGFEPLDELQVDAFVSRFYDHLDLQRTYNLPYPKAIQPFLKDVEVFYNEGLSPNQVPQQIRDSIKSFFQMLHQNRLMTFGDMIRYATAHLVQHGPVAGLRSLYVDEYQDVNPAQVQLIQAMMCHDTRLTVVGDDLQCIYQWRGSDVERILRFNDEFADSPTEPYRLSDNYRSRPQIVTLGNEVARTVTRRASGEGMKSKRPASQVQCVHWFSTASDEEQAEAVADIVVAFIEASIPSSQIAVLLRSVRSHGGLIVEALLRHNIKVQSPILGRGGEFINGFLIPLFDFLQEDTQEPKNEEETAEQEQRTDNLWQAARQWISENLINAEEVFWGEVWKWKDLISASHNTAYDVRGRLYDLFNMCQIGVAPEDYNLMVGLGIASQVIRSVEEIHRRRVLGHQRRTARGITREVYHALKRRHADFGESVPIDTAVEGVVVTTIHQAKGLEWPVVIIPMLVKDRFPLKSVGHGTSFPDAIASRYGTQLDDEKRLFYVAATRARERLFLLDSKLNAKEKRSVFLNELAAAGAIIPERTIPDDEIWQLEEKDTIYDNRSLLRLGLSDLLIYLECPYQFGLRRIAAIQPSVGEELGYGLGLHELIQRRLEAPQPWEKDELVKQVDAFVVLPLMSEEGEHHSREAIRNRIEQLEALQAFDTEAETELSVEVLLNGGLVHGVIDMVQINGDGSILIRDWKSSIHNELLPRYERQIRFYAHALRQLGRNVVAADIVDVASSAKQNRLVTYEIDIAEPVISQLIDELNNAIVSINNGVFRAQPDQQVCSACDMWRICSERWKQDD